VTKPATQQGDRSVRPPSAKPRRKGRRAKKIIIVVLVLVALLVGADFGLAAVAEHTVSQKAREQLNLVEDPSVTIHGFPFTTQAIGGDYGHISLSATGLRVTDQLRDADVTAELRDVKAPLSDLISGNTNSITIGDLEGKIRIKATDIARIEPLNKVQDLRIEPATEDFVRTGKTPENKPTTTANPDDKQDSLIAGIQISGTLPIAGILSNFSGNTQVENPTVDCYALIQLDGKVIRITPERVRFGNGSNETDVPSEVVKSILQSFKAEIDTSKLPFPVTPTAVKVESGAVTLTGKAKDTNFAGLKAGK
jgi:hypothetical protein